MPDQNAARVELLADRLAILLVVVKQRYGTEWEPWFGESVWEQEDHLGDEIREWPQYIEAMNIVRQFIRRHDARTPNDTT
jgi:hypothetical protein